MVCDPIRALPDNPAQPQHHVAEASFPPPLVETPSLASYVPDTTTLSDLRQSPFRYSCPPTATEAAFLPVPSSFSTGGGSSLRTLPAQQSPAMEFDTTGQIAPPGMKPRVTATLWEDEGSLCFHVEARGICVTRREDNHMINGSKLLNVAGMTRGRRDGILKSEKVRHVVKIGPMHLKGVWIPFDRALEFANKERITELLYPLFVHNIGALLYHPVNQGRMRTSQVMAVAVEQRRSAGGQDRPNVSDAQLPAFGYISGGPSLKYERPPLHRAHPFPTPPTSASSIMGGMGASDNFDWTRAEPNASSHCSPQTPPGSLDHGSQLFRQPSPIPAMGQMKRERSVEASQTPNLGHHKLGSLKASPGPIHPQTRLQLDTPTAAPEPSPVSETETVSSHTASDYSASSEEDEELLDTVDQKRALLERLMRFFFLIISAPRSPGVYARNCGAHVEAQGNSSGTGSGHTAQQGQGPSATSSSSGRPSNKRKIDGADDCEDADDGRDSKRRQPSASDKPAELPPQRLACPFFKNNQSRYRKWRSCPGPGWATVHRIKEHVYRKHALPIRCPRCGHVFETERRKDDHISQEERCVQVEDQARPEGIDADKEKLLRSRKGKNKEASEVDKWNEMYMILFPEADSTSLPSPYYEYSPTEGNTPGSPEDEFVRYEQFLRRELPGRVRQELETRIDERLNPIEEGLRDELVEIVRDMQLQLFELYKASRNTVSDPNDPMPDPRGEHSAPQPAQLVQDMGQLEAFAQPPLVDTTEYSLSFNNFDGQIWDPSAFDVQTSWGWDSGAGIIQPSLAFDEYVLMQSDSSIEAGTCAVFSFIREGVLYQVMRLERHCRPEAKICAITNFVAASRIHLEIGVPEAFTAYPAKEKVSAEFEAELYIYDLGKQEPRFLRRITRPAEGRAIVDIKNDHVHSSPDSVVFLLAMRVYEPRVDRTPLQSLTSEDIFGWIGADPSSSWATGAMWETIFFRREDKTNRVSELSEVNLGPKVEQRKRPLAVLSNIILGAELDMQALFWKVRFLVKTAGFLAQQGDSKFKAAAPDAGRNIESGTVPKKQRQNSMNSIIDLDFPGRRDIASLHSDLVQEDIE
ncbi:hypothetical protein OQA88_10256 [Cercophora sp. LCS_1]